MVVLFLLTSVILSQWTRADGDSFFWALLSSDDEPEWAVGNFFPYWPLPPSHDELGRSGGNFAFPFVLWLLFFQAEITDRCVHCATRYEGPPKCPNEIKYPLESTRSRWPVIHSTEYIGWVGGWGLLSGCLGDACKLRRRRKRRRRKRTQMGRYRLCAIKPNRTTQPAPLREAVIKGYCGSQCSFFSAADV